MKKGGGNMGQVEGKKSESRNRGLNTKKRLSVKSGLVYENNMSGAKLIGKISVQEMFNQAKCLSFSSNLFSGDSEKKFVINSSKKKIRGSKIYRSFIKENTKTQEDNIAPKVEEYTNSMLKTPEIQKMKSFKVKSPKGVKTHKKVRSSLIGMKEGSKSASKLKNNTKSSLIQKQSFAGVLTKKIKRSSNKNLGTINYPSKDKSRAPDLTKTSSFCTVVYDSDKDASQKESDSPRRKPKKDLPNYSRKKHDRMAQRSTSNKRECKSHVKGYMKATFSYKNSKQREAVHLKKKFKKAGKQEEIGVDVKPKSSLENFVYSSKILTTKNNKKLSLSFATNEHQVESFTKTIKRNYNKPWLECMKLGQKSTKNDAKNVKTNATTARSMSVRKTTVDIKTPIEISKKRTPKLTITTESSSVKPNTRFEDNYLSSSTNKSTVRNSEKLKISLNTPAIKLEKKPPRVSKFESLRKKQYMKISHYCRPSSSVSKRVNADIYEIFPND
ncbi:unnamed protein product [Moneuplotes crassus]|uniref:Uncharacterized protein n=1 Tax=Euplotes crassus TaxID=5936 RepID=A0AAD1U5Q2_EUPCR|nr:unnamed protein product [Moneuplotes crassus]